jgi:hypothetical protein
MRDILILIGKCILPDDRYGLTGKASKNDETGDLRLPPVGSLVVYLPLFRALEQTEYGRQVIHFLQISLQNTSFVRDRDK